jgi:proliferating cell nuclear antigen
MKFYLKTVTPKVLTSCLEVLKDILQDINVVVSPSGIKVLTYDTARVALVDLNLPSDKFEEYSCSNTIIAGLSISNTYKILKSVTMNDMLEMYMTHPDHITLKVTNTDKKTSTEYNLKLLEIDEEFLQQPSLQFECVTILTSVEFQKICRDMANLSTSSIGSIRIKRSKSTLSLEFKGDFASQTTIIDCAEHNGEEIVGDFSLKYMLMFTKATALCSNVQILQNTSDDPLVLKYLVSNLGELTFYIHPLLTEYD